MTSFNAINKQLLDEFEEALKERKCMDHNFINVEMIEAVIKVLWFQYRRCEII